MEILKWVSFAWIATLLIVLVGNQDKTFALMIRMTAVVILLIFITSQLGGVIGIVRHLAEKTEVSSTYFNIILKIIGIAYIAEFGYQMCKDAGENAIASKVQFAGKAMILTVSAPIILALIELITTFL